jgi:hypothetical protein
MKRLIGPIASGLTLAVLVLFAVALVLLFV